MVFSVWLLSMFSWLVHIVECVSISFLFTAKFIAESSTIWTYHLCVPIHKLMDIDWGVSILGLL